MGFVLEYPSLVKREIIQSSSDQEIMVHINFERLELGLWINYWSDQHILSEVEFDASESKRILNIFANNLVTGFTGPQNEIKIIAHVHVDRFSESYRLGDPIVRIVETISPYVVSNEHVHFLLHIVGQGQPRRIAQTI